jgi:hypothetical protein
MQGLYLRRKYRTPQNLSARPVNNKQYETVHVYILLEPSGLTTYTEGLHSGITFGIIFGLI